MIGLELSRLGGPKPTAQRLGLRPAQSGPLPELWGVPEFSFRDQRRLPLGPAALEGQVWIADFIFTTCSSVCPLLTAKMVMLQHQLREPSLRFVSFSVDPERDVPEVMARYAAQWNAGESRWSLLSTDTKGLESLAAGMFVAVTPSNDLKEPILHSSKFFLVDQRGNVRGVYDSADDQALQRLVRDTHTLLGTPSPATAGVEGSGERLFAAMGCGACHDNPQLAPSLRGLAGGDVQLATGERVKADAGYLRNSLLAPGQQLVAGYLNNMPSYADVLTVAQVDSLVGHLQALAPVADAPSTAVTWPRRRSPPSGPHGPARRSRRRSRWQPPSPRIRCARCKFGSAQVCRTPSMPGGDVPRRLRGSAGKVSEVGRREAQLPAGTSHTVLTVARGAALALQMADGSSRASSS